MISKNKNLTAVILAGGLGTRLRPIVKDIPKPMAVINRRPFLEYQLDYLRSYGILNIIMSVGYLGEKIRDHFSDDWKGMKIDYTYEKKLLGTGGALKLASKKLAKHSQALVMNGDSYFPINLEKFLHFHNEKFSDLTISLFENTSAGRYSGFNLSESSQIQKVNHHNSRFKSGGIYMFSKNILNKISSLDDSFYSFENDLTPAFLSDSSRVFGFHDKAQFIDIGMPKDFRRASIFFQNLKL